MVKRIVEVQRTEEIETMHRLALDVPDAVAKSDDPDELTDWVSKNVPEKDIAAARAVMTARVSVVSADLID